MWQETMVVCSFAFFLPQLHGRRKHRAYSIEHHVGNGRVAKFRGFVRCIIVDTMHNMQCVDVACHGHGRVVANCVAGCGFLCDADCDIGCLVAIATRRGDWCCAHYFFLFITQHKKECCPGSTSVAGRMLVAFTLVTVRGRVMRRSHRPLTLHSIHR